MTKATGQSGSDRARKEAQGAPVSGVLTKPEAEREVAVARAGQIKPAGQAAEECAAPQFVKLSTAESETLARRLDLATSLFVGSMNETYTEQSRGHLRQMLELVCTGQVKTAWGMHRVTSLREGMPEADFETLGARFEPAIARPSERNDAITEQLLKTGWQWVVDEAAAKGEVTFFKPGVIRGPRHGELTATGSVFFDPAVAREARSGEGNKADVVKVTGNVTGFYFRSEVIDDPARLEPSTDNKKDRKDREDEGAITDELVTYFEAKNLPRELWEPTAAEIERVIRKQGVANPDWDGGGHVGDVVRYFECGRHYNAGRPAVART
jgi:hypothetical protein